MEPKQNEFRWKLNDFSVLILRIRFGWYNPTFYYKLGYFIVTGDGGIIGINFGGCCGEKGLHIFEDITKIHLSSSSVTSNYVRLCILCKNLRNFPDEDCITVLHNLSIHPLPPSPLEWHIIQLEEDFRMRYIEGLWDSERDFINRETLISLSRTDGNVIRLHYRLLPRSILA